MRTDALKRAQHESFVGLSTALQSFSTRSVLS